MKAAEVSQEWHIARMWKKPEEEELIVGGF